MPCNHKCTNWQAKRPSNGKRYESGQIRCDTCQIFMYPSLETTHNNKTKEPDDNPEHGLACNCCHMRISGRSYSSKYGRYQNPNSPKTFEELEKYFEEDIQPKANYQFVIVKTLLENNRSCKVDNIKEAIKFYNKTQPNIDYEVGISTLINHEFISIDEDTVELNIDDSPISVEKNLYLISLCNRYIYQTIDSKNTQYFIALGPWSNWDHTLKNPPFRWGVNPSSASNIGVFNALNPGDVVYFYANQDSPTPFSNRGLFGVGKVIRKYDEDKELYWPDEKLKNHIIYKHRFEIDPLKIVYVDSDSLQWIDGLPFTKGLNRIANPDTLQQLIDNTQKIWNIDLKSTPTSVNYWKVAPGTQAEDWDEQLKNGIIAIGWEKLGDLSNIHQEELSKRMRENYPESVAQRYQIESFLKIKQGDIIIANKGKSTIVGIGRVIGNYKYYAALKQPHTYQVDWFDTKPRQIPTQNHWFVTVLPVSSYVYGQLLSDDIFTDEQNYLLIRHSIKRDSYWKDEFGKIYHFGKIPNYTKLVAGSKVIWYDRLNGKYILLGFGDVKNIDENRIRNEFYAEMETFEKFDPPKEASDKLRSKITNLPSFNNQHSIFPITKDIYDEIVYGKETSTLSVKTFDDDPLLIPKKIYHEIINRKLDLESFENTKLVLPKQNLDEAKKEIQKHLLIPGDVIDQIINSLYSGKHVILTGPVGTGKTHLAQLIPKIIWGGIGGYYPETITATSEWTTQDVIGGIFPKVSGNEVKYIIQKGCVAETVSQNWQDGTGKSGKRQKFKHDGILYNGTWLIIDEFNRANIDRAFGPLFTALEYKNLKIPTTNPDESFEELIIPEDYRIIGTLNTFDKHFLFKLSDALKRRFSFIEILPPTYNEILEEIRFVSEKALEGYDDIKQELNIKTFDDLRKNPELYSLLSNLYDIMAFVRMSKNLGTAVLISMFRFALINYLRTKNPDQCLDTAAVTNLLPHLESLQYWQIDSIMNFVSGRIHEMFRKFDVNKRPDVDRYEDELRNLTKYLTIAGINKAAGDWFNKFRTGEIMKMTNLSDLDPWVGKQRPKLQKFRQSLESLKREKGYFEDVEGLTE